MKLLDVYNSDILLFHIELQPIILIPLFSTYVLYTLGHKYSKTEFAIRL
jgi:hypothetical protein